MVSRNFASRLLIIIINIGRKQIKMLVSNRCSIANRPLPGIAQNVPQRTILGGGRFWILHRLLTSILVCFLPILMIIISSLLAKLQETIHLPPSER